MMRRSKAGLAALTAAMIAGAGPAIAHPHVWVQMRSSVVFDDQGLVTGVRLAWTFDDGYQEAALDGLDANGDGDYSQAELADLTQENIASLRDYGYFTRPKADGEDVALGEVTDYGQAYKDGRLELHFTVPLAVPLDPRRRDFFYRVYDPEFFIAIDFAKDAPVSAVGAMPSACRIDLMPVVADQQSEDTRQMLASKGKDWQPPPDEDFGAMFAQAVHVTCAAEPLAAARAPAASETPSVADKGRLLVRPRHAAASFWDDPAQWLMDRQRRFYGAMRGSLSAIKSEAPLAAALTLMMLSFAYGVLHAAGPGHGKAVVSSWLLATESQLRRGILVAFLSSLVQALSAIAIVSALLLAAANVGTASRGLAGAAESLSYALIAAMGLYLSWSVVRPRRFAAAFSGPGHHVHEAHGHGHDVQCGHAHAPEVRGLERDWSLGKALSLSAAVGLRPCTGAILALIFAQAVGLYWAGIAATFAMALGTFLTVALIAAMTVYSRQLALKLASRDAAWLGRAILGLKLGGGIVVAGLGLLLFWGSLGAGGSAAM